MSFRQMTFFCDYVNADADAVTTEEPIDHDIVYVTGPADASDGHALVSHAHTFDVPTSFQAHDAVDLVRRFFGAHNDGQNGTNAVTSAEKKSRLRCPKQKCIMDVL